LECRFFLEIGTTTYDWGTQEFSVKDQSQVVCSRKLVEKQPSIKKPTPNVPSNTNKPTSVVQKVPVGELKKEKPKASQCPNTSAPLKKTPIQFKCLVSNVNSIQIVMEPKLNSDSAETHVSEGNIPLTFGFRTFSLVLLELFYILYD
jgi:hypothetical protein